MNIYINKKPPGLQPTKASQLLGTSVFQESRQQLGFANGPNWGAYVPQAPVTTNSPNSLPKSACEEDKRITRSVYPSMNSADF